MADLRSDYRRDPYVDDAEALSRRLSSSLGRSSPKSPAEALQPEPVPPPPLRSRAVRHPLVVFLNFVLTIVIIGIVAIGGGVFAAKMQFERPGSLDQARPVTVEFGGGLGAIADQLQKDGVISSKWLFVAGVMLARQQGALKAGEYLIPAHASMHDVMESMVAGKGILYTISIPEGLTSQQIVDRLKSEDILTGDIAETPPEGSLLPETYKVPRGATRESVLANMRRERDRVVADVWQRRAQDLPIQTPEQLVVLASVVEKETALADERSRVAAVFVNRLRLNMRLQSDPTVIYGMFGGEGKPNGFMLSRADLEKQSPYNTYVVAGLPPGPIANPGRASLEAVANPSRTRDLFFVADGSGGHAFAESYEAHLKNVSRWRDISANSGAAAAAGETTAPAATAPDAAADEAAPAATGGTQAARPAVANPPAPVPKPRVKVPAAQTSGDDQPLALTPTDQQPDPEGAAGQ
jgi:UPF0755 protein